jgi:hypothetical protein
MQPLPAIQSGYGAPPRVFCKQQLFFFGNSAGGVVEKSGNTLIAISSLHLTTTPLILRSNNLSECKMSLFNYHNLQYLAAHLPELPIPRVHGFILLGNVNAMFMFSTVTPGIYDMNIALTFPSKIKPWTLGIGSSGRWAARYWRLHGVSQSPIPRCPPP